MKNDTLAKACGLSPRADEQTVVYILHPYLIRISTALRLVKSPKHKSFMKSTSAFTFGDKMLVKVSHVTGIK